MTNATKLLQALGVAALVSLSASAHAQAINFDGTSAPCCFVSTSPLTTLYSAQGITFSGVDGNGGSVLNESGGFGFNAHSGTDFLAFNTNVGTGIIERISFANAATSVSIWAANRQGGLTTLEAFNAQNQLVASASVNASTTWQQLLVTGTGITSVRLTGAGYAFAYDDLNVAAVPEPETWALLMAGIGLMGGVARRRRRS